VADFSVRDELKEFSQFFLLQSRGTGCRNSPCSVPIASTDKQSWV